MIGLRAEASGGRITVMRKSSFLNKDGRGKKWLVSLEVGGRWQVLIKRRDRPMKFLRKRTVP